MSAFRLPSSAIRTSLFRIQSKRSFWATSGLLFLTVLAAGAGAVVVDRTDQSSTPWRLPPHWQAGANLTAFLPDAYAEPAADRALLTARAAGTELVALTPTSYMETPESTEIKADPAKTPTDASVLTAAREARRLGFDVAIKPHVDVRDGTFRGEIQPLDREAWFASYGELVDHYAKLAQRAGAKTFVIGTELTSVSGDGEQWRELISQARERFDGKITFAANWVDGAEAIGFWDALDMIGIDGYMPLGTEANPSVEDLVTEWGPYAERMMALHERWGKRILFTELGYESRLGTAARIEQGTAPISEAAQANAYEAAFRALTPLPFFRGIWWWEWSAEGIGIGPGDGGFSPEGKEAADVLEDWQG